MPNDPKYVRLANRLSLQTIADIAEYGSGWSISGLDVKEFPDDEAARYVRLKLGQGVLEPATQAEFDEVHDDEETIAVVDRYRDASQPHPWQESAVQAAHAKRRRVIESSRYEEEETDEEADAERRQAILEEQDELGLGTDDPEEQVGRTARGGPRAKKSGAAKKSAKRRVNESEEDQP